MIEYFIYATQLILFGGSLLIAYLILRKNSKYIGNRLLAGCFSLVGIYAFVLFLYKVLQSAVLLQYSIRIGFTALIFAVYLLFLTIQVLVHSSHVLADKPIKIYSWLVIAIITTGCMIFTDWLIVENNDIQTLDYLDWVFFLFAGYIGIMLIYSAIVLYIKGIRVAHDTSTRKMKLFLTGLGFMLLGLITEGLSSVFLNLALILDLCLFLSLSIGIIFMAHSFLLKTKTPN